MALTAHTQTMANNFPTHFKRFKARVKSHTNDTSARTKSADILQKENRLLKRANQDLRRKNIEQRMIILAALADSAERLDGFF